MILSRPCRELRLTGLAALLGLAAAVPATAAQAAPPAHLPRFELTLLAVPAGTESSAATAVNPSGEVAGVVKPPDDLHLASFTAFWADVHAPPVLATGPGTQSSEAGDLHTSGLVVGTGNLDGTGTFIPFTWNSGQDVDPIAAFGGVTGNSAAGINERGVLVGSASFPGVGNRPARWDHGVPTNLGLVAGDLNGRAAAISDSGQIVGRSGTRAARWSGGVALRLEFPGAISSDAYDVNDRGLAVGKAFNNSNGNSAVLWRGTQPVVLPTLGGELGKAFAINDRDWIVGSTEAFPPTAASDLDLLATLWIHERALDLNALTIDLPDGVVLNAALDVNDAGQIVGQALVDGVPRPFLLDPAGS